MGGAVFPPYNLAWGPTLVGVMAIMVASFKRACARTDCCIQCPWPHGRPLLSILASARDSWMLTGKSGSVFCGVTAPFSWVLVRTRFCLPRVYFPVLWHFCNQIPLAFKVKFPGSSQFLCWIPRLGNLLWALEFLQQCGSFFGIIVLQFVGCLLRGSMVGLTHHVSQLCCNQSPHPCSQPLLTRASVEDTQTLKVRSGSVSCGVPESWCTISWVIPDHPDMPGESHGLRSLEGLQSTGSQRAEHAWNDWRCTHGKEMTLAMVLVLPADRAVNFLYLSSVFQWEHCIDI